MGPLEKNDPIIGQSEPQQLVCLNRKKYWSLLVAGGAWRQSNGGNPPVLRTSIIGQHGLQWHCPSVVQRFASAADTLSPLTQPGNQCRKLRVSSPPRFQGLPTICIFGHLHTVAQDCLKQRQWPHTRGGGGGGPGLLKALRDCRRRGRRRPPHP